jgi:NRPS condensation-like uncharacterized protein
MKSVLVDDTFHLLQAVGDFQIGLVMQSAGCLDPARLKRALSELLIAFPVLARAYVPGWRRGRWEQRDQSSDQLLMVASVKDAVGQIPAFFSSPINTYAGPQMRCLLLQGEQNYLCLNVSHFVTDATGVKALACLLCRAYDAPDLIKPGNHERGLDILFKQFPGWRKIGLLRRTIQDLAGQLPFPPAAALPGLRSVRFDRQYVIRKMGPETTRCLKDLAAGYQATVNDVLMAAFIRSLMRFVPPEKRPAWRLVVTADLRRHLPAGQQAGQVRNLSGWVLTSIGRDPGRCLEETCRRVSAQMVRLKNRNLGLGMFPLVWLAVRGLPLAVARAGIEILAPPVLKRITVAPSFTNMGRIDDRALVFDGRSVEDAFLLPPVVHAPILGVGISQYRDTMTLSSGFNVPGFAVRDVSGLLDGIMAEIQAA